MGVSKRRQAMASIDPTKLYSFEEAVKLVKKCANAKFDKALMLRLTWVLMHVNLTKTFVVPVLPAGNGKTVRVAVFAQGAQAEAAKEAGADIVGTQDLAQSIKDGNLDFDVVIAAPDTMRFVGQLGTILGPRGLMPNPKVGTVTPNVAEAVKNAKGGQVRYRNDKNGIIHCSICKVSFSDEDIKTNLQALLADLKKAKPASAKGVFLKKLSLSSTMVLV